MGRWEGQVWGRGEVGWETQSECPQDLAKVGGTVRERGRVLCPTWWSSWVWGTGSERNGTGHDRSGLIKMGPGFPAL